ncbi:MAG: alpha amylase C-terminal domain-containing protein, partial [Pseudomonadota bacterium]
ENFMLPLSHDEVVHGKRSLIGRMPGDEWREFANLRAYLGSMYAHPGKKLLFMGSEFAQRNEWNHNQSLDWHLLEHAPHSGMQALVRDLNALYTTTPALYEIDFESRGFEWITLEDRDQSVLAWVRRDRNGGYVAVLCNMTPVVREGYRIGLAEGHDFEVALNTDDERYGGSGVHPGELKATEEDHLGRPYSMQLTLPPLATLILKPRAHTKR